MRSGGYATRPAAVAARRADATIHAAKDRLKQASRGFLTFAAGGGGGGGGGTTTTTTTTTSGNIDNDDDDDDRDGDGDHPQDGTSGDRPPVPRSPKASSRDPNARPGRNAKVTSRPPPPPNDDWIGGRGRIGGRWRPRLRRWPILEYWKTRAAAS
jgi:hypothetical protein